jgi:hypothetical protein
MASLKRAGYSIIVGIDTMVNKALFSIFADKFVWIMNPNSSEKLSIYRTNGILTDWQKA